MRTHTLGVEIFPKTGLYHGTMRSTNGWVLMMSTTEGFAIPANAADLIAERFPELVRPDVSDRPVLTTLPELDASIEITEVIPRDKREERYIEVSRGSSPDIDMTAFKRLVAAGRLEENTVNHDPELSAVYKVWVPTTKLA